MTTPLYGWRVPSDNEGNKALSVRELAGDIEGTVSNGVAIFATSTTSRSIGLGTKNFTVQAGRSFLVPLPFVLISAASNQANWMLGKVLSYDNLTGALSVDVQQIRGSGTIANWKIGLSGPPSNIFYSATKRWQIVIDDSGGMDTQEV